MGQVHDHWAVGGVLYEQHVAGPVFVQALAHKQQGSGPSRQKPPKIRLGTVLFYIGHGDLPDRDGEQGRIESGKAPAEIQPRQIGEQRQGNQRCGQSKADEKPGTVAEFTRRAENEEGDSIPKEVAAVPMGQVLGE
jgi:hypothetical protein